MDVEYQSDQEKTLMNTTRGLKRKYGIYLNTDDWGSEGGVYRSGERMMADHFCRTWRVMIQH